jgi:Ca2+/H+ antiporter, TMEM165/GDT1 family
VTSTIILVLAVFGATCVEAVEALTLVVASGTTRGWRSAFEGAASALVLLIVLVAAIGVPIVHYVPIDVLRVVIGGLLLVLGLGWLRKSILRASGHKALHDEDLIYANTVAELGAADTPSPKQRDAVGFTIAFKGVLLEGTEVLLIVLSLGASSHRLGLAAVAAGAAVVVVTAVGIIVARQLREVPENTMKLAVGVMLTSFGIFWVGEGSGFHWPGSDLAILVLIALFVAVTYVSIRYLRLILPNPSGSPTAVQTSERH